MARFRFMIVALLCALAPAQAAPQVLACEGAFARDTTRARLTDTFGAKALKDERIFGPEGTDPLATLIHPSDASRRLEVIWRMDDPAEGVLMVRLVKQSKWTLANGLRLGLTLQEAERLNGKPFTVEGFADNGGTAEWDGGKLAGSIGSCRVHVRFAPDPRTPRRLTQPVSGSQEPYASRDRAITATKPRIAEITLFYDEAP